MVSPGHRHNVIASQMSARTYQYSQLAFSAHTWVRSADCPSSTRQHDTTKARQTDRPTETLRAHPHTRAAQQVKTQQCATNELARDPMWRLLRWTAAPVCVHHFVRVVQIYYLSRACVRDLYRWYSFVFVSNHTWSHVTCVCMLPTCCAPATYQFCSFRAVHKMYCL